MGKTAKYELPYPEETDVANVPGDLKKLAEKTEEAIGKVDILVLADLFYPIGRGFLDFTDTDYSNWLGLTWERELVGMTPIGKNALDTDFATVGKKGGEKTHTLTVNEMPSHTHTQNPHHHLFSEGGNTISVYANSGVLGGAGFVTSSPNTAWAGTNINLTGIAQSTATNQNTGGGQAHNNLPPYQVVSYWKRVGAVATTINTFTIDNSNTVYQFEEGMTWRQWCNSSYNTGGWYVDTPNSIWSGDWHIDGANIVTQQIVAGTNYDAIREK